MGEELVLVAGGGGFIGGHLVQALTEQGHRVRAVDAKPMDDWHQMSSSSENLQLDLSEIGACRRATKGVSTVYNLAADMGGMGFIENNKALCMLSVLINTHMLHGGARGRRGAVLLLLLGMRVRRRQADRDRASPRSRRTTPIRPCPRTATAGRSSSASACAGTSARTSGSRRASARYHNVYGPHGTYDGGREKAPAAICRKVVEAKIGGNHEIEIWGDGNQTRSFMYIDDCLKGTLRLTASDVVEPINIGSSRAGHRSISWSRSSRRSPASSLNARLQPRRAAGRAREKQRQHPDPRTPRVGAHDLAPGRPGADLPLDLRRDRQTATAGAHRRAGVRHPSLNRCAMTSAEPLRWRR